MAHKHQTFMFTENHCSTLFNQHPGWENSRLKIISGFQIKVVEKKIATLTINFTNDTSASPLSNKCEQQNRTVAMRNFKLTRTGRYYLNKSWRCLLSRSIYSDKNILSNSCFWKDSFRYINRSCQLWTKPWARVSGNQTPCFRRRTRVYWRT